jgi:class 3 adenylate cyclase/CHASE2 domain-containing sensor protein
VTKARKSQLLGAVIAAAATLISALSVIFIAPLAGLETKLADIRVAALQPPLPPSDQLVVIALDEATLARLPYRSPIDRGLLADLLEAVAKKGARAIALDILIDQPTEPDKDARLKTTIASLTVPVRVSFTSSPTIVTPEQLAYMAGFVPADKRMDARMLTDPFDGMVRRINPGGVVRNGTRTFNALSPRGFVPTMVALAGRPPVLEPIAIAWRPRPDADNQPFPTFSANYLPFLPDALIKGKIVLIGAVLSITDRHLTPLAIIDEGDQGHMPGVLVQAHGIAQLLEGRQPPSLPLGWQLAIIGGFAVLGLIISLMKRGIAFNVGIAGLVVALYWVGAILGFGQGLPMVPLLGPTIALGLSMWMMDLILGRAERVQREFIQRTFSRYVSPAVVDQLVDDPSSATIQGTRREASFIFTDVAGFTTLSERLAPEKLSEVLNAYLDGACAIILKHEGTIDKFIGDAIMAVFNAPVAQADHADRAVRCALDIDAYAEDFRTRCNADGVPFGITRIGVHCGDAIIGNFGSQARMDFTALGDTVNTAARTESVNKYFGTRICCTEPIVAACPGRRFRPIGDIVLKGKTTPTRLFVPVADGEDTALLHAYAGAYNALEQASVGANAAFHTLADRFPADPLVQFHCKRLAAGEHSTIVVMDDK